MLIVARINGAAIGDLFRSIQLSEGAVIAIFDSQRRVLYRSTTENTYLGTDRSDSPLFTPLEQQSKAVVEATSPYDGISRVYGLVVVGSTDCVVATGVPSSTLYSPARRQIIRYLIFCLVALLCAIAAAILAVIGNILTGVERTHAEIARLIGSNTRKDIAFTDEQLTEAEERIAAAVASGLSNKEIASDLGLGVRTVEKHISHILAKKNF